jgi:predicted MFS family arabinose efflux permease
MALAAPVVMPIIPADRRGLAGGAIFTGVGLGIAASGTLVPALMEWGLAETWFGLGALSLALTALAWNSWPAAVPSTPAVPQKPLPAGSAPALRALYVEYALNAVGLVPHMVFLVDFVARGLGRGLHSGAMYWIVFGAGAVIGPIVGGHAGDRLGFRTALRFAFVVQALCVALPLVAVSSIALAVSSFIVGAFVPGIVAITIGRVRELIPADPAAQAAAWGYCTTAFAIGQAVAGYAFSYLFARSDNGYPVLFALAAAALLLALVIDLVSARSMARAGSGHPVA